MPVIRVDDLDDPRLADYRNIPDGELVRNRRLFVAEGRLVVRRLLARSLYPARSLLVTQTALDSLRLDDLLQAGRSDLPIYVCEQPMLNAIVGYNIHRGCLALGERPAETALGRVPEGWRLVVVLEGVVNADNVGGVFRNAAAFGADAVLLSPVCCDPLYRKAIRTSMGATLSVPFAQIHDWPGGLERLRERGFAIVALTPRMNGADIGALAATLEANEPVALLLGAEWAGLSPAAESHADHLVRIPIGSAVDSLNVAAAAGIALHRVAEVQGIRFLEAR